MVFILCLIFSCSLKKSSSIEKQIFRDVEKYHKEVVSLSDYTKFDWDTAYFFLVPMSLSDVEDIIKINNIEYEEQTLPLIFIKAGRIVHQENFGTYSETLQPGQFVYERLDTTYSSKDSFVKIDRKDDKIKVRIEQYEGVKYLLFSKSFK